MTSISNSTVINQTVEKTFDFIVNIENHKAWQPMLLEAKMIPPGPVNVGSIYAYTTEVVGRKIETKMEVSQFEQNRLWAFKINGMPRSVETIYLFEPDGSGVKLTITMDVPPGAYPAAAESIIMAQMQKSLVEQGEHFKKILEA